MKIVRLSGANARLLTAVFLLFAFIVTMIQPRLIVSAQEPASIATQTNDTTQPKKAKKKKSKRDKAEESSQETKQIVLPPEIFGAPAPQQPAAPTTIDQKAKTFGKPGQLPVGRTYKSVSREIEVAPPVDLSELARQEALEPSSDIPAEIKAINPPKERPNVSHGTPIILPANVIKSKAGPVQAPTPSTTGTSPGPSKTFKGQFLSSTIIPPDTHGAVGPNHVVSSSNDFLRIQTRDGAELSRATINSFWSAATVKGVAVASAFDTKVLYDRFNDRFILVSSLNGPGINSGMGVAVTQTGDPTGTWFRYTAASDPASTASAGHAIDYPSVGFNKNWIVVDENTFNYSGSSFTTYFGQQVFILDKQAAYNNTVGSFSLIEGPFSTCLGDATDNANLGCGFTVVPSVNEENTTDTMFVVEDWDNIAGQLRVGKITGTPAAPVLTEGIQFPQSPFSWNFSAARIGTTNGCGGTCSGGYLPQRQQSANLASSQRIAGNDSRIQNVVYRNGFLWTTHHVMVAATTTLAGSGFGTSNPDTHSAIQWWEIDPSIQTGLSTPPIQRARIEDATADNCNNGAGGTRNVAPCNGTTANQFGQFFAYPNISVNVNNDVLIGFTQFSPLTYASSAYAIRLSTDPPNTTRDPVVFRPGQANYNIGSGSGTSRNNRWGDYSRTQTDPVNDTTFWTVQEYAGTVRDFGIGLAGNWETWWAQVNPTATAPSKSGNLIIDEFRLRGPQGARDEYVELYNPNSSPIIVNTTDNSEGWALVSNNGTTSSVLAVIPNGTVIPARGHFLVADNPDGANGPTVVYSLNTYPATEVRGADSDTGWSFDISDTSGLAIFKTATPANFSAATLMDAAGPATLPAGSLFKEGTGFGTLPTSNLQYTMFRRFGSGVPVDSNNNATDFTFADTAGTGTSAGQNLGAPAPKNLDSTIQRNAGFGAFRLDQSVSSSGPPNRVRDFTSDPANNSTFGTLTVRNRIVNNTGGPVTRLRFRVVNMTTFPAPAGIADLRLRTSVDSVSVSVNDAATCGGPAPCFVTVKGLTLETPPAQAAGGGMNSTVSAGFVTLGTPLANGASANLQFLLGVQQAGTFRFFLNVEALP